MSDNTLHRYRFLSGFCFDLVELDLYCYPWLPCHPKRVRVALVSIRKKKAAITGGKDSVFMVRVLIAKCIAVFGPVENFPKEEFDGGNNTNHGK